MNSSKLWVVIVGFQALTLAGQWLGQPALLQSAQAQIPDAGAQQQQVIDELKSLNSKMDKLVGLLESGNVQVKTTAGEESKPAR